MASPLDRLSQTGWDRVDQFLDRALELELPERSTYLESLDPSDRALVEQLLHAGEDLGPLDDAVRLTSPESILGSWRLGERIGEGGSSEVFEAYHLDTELPLRAALKRMRRGPGTGPFLERFRRERKILLSLRHPLVVRLLDGGTSEAGEPWYVMEFIEGLPITDWARSQSMQQRLEALVAVCRAVEYAHQRLVVHCDLKPENILMDADQQPRMLDFGISKLLDDAEQTQTGMRMLTPRWAAPEQVSGRPVTTQTDVHALGLLLWALVTGETPRAGMTGTSLLAAIPTAVLASPSTHSSAARGDLDAIFHRASALDPSARYRGAAELADDLERSLRGEAVLARDRAWLYQLTRWVRTHRAAVATGLLTLSLLAGWAGSSQVQSARLLAENQRAERETARAEGTLELLVSMLEAADPGSAQGEEITVREVLDQGARQLESSPEELQGDLFAVVGRVQTAVGDVKAARGSLDRAVGLLELRSKDDPTLRRARFDLVRAAFLDAPEQGLPQAEQLLAERQTDGTLTERAASLLQVAEMYGHQQRFLEASEHSGEARKLYLQLGDARAAARARAVEGYALVGRGDRVRGREVLVSALEEMVQALGTRTHPEVADLLHELAMAAENPEALRFAQEATDLRRKLFGRTFRLATTLNNHALAVESTDPGLASELLLEAVEIAVATRGPDDPRTLRLQLNLGAVLVGAGNEDGRSWLIQVRDHPASSPALSERATYWLEKVPWARSAFVGEP